jgi:hypothetical protein
MLKPFRWVVPAVPLLSLLLGSRGARADVIVPGLISAKLEPELRGLVLIEELRCAACHAADASLIERSKQAPRLGDVGGG